MPTITLNKNVFEKLVGKKLPLDQLKERIAFLGTDLESIEGNEINVEVFPNRPDMLSEQGFARAFSSFIGVKKGLKNYSVKSSGKKLIVERSVTNVRPYTACAIVTGLNFDDEKIREVIQIQEKLHITYGRNRKKAAIGIYPNEKITYPITFKGVAPDKIKFQPLEYPKELTGLQILAQHPTGREYGHLLEERTKFPLFVDANNKVLSMPPIINSHDIGKITEKTKDVFIECSGFDLKALKICLNIVVTALSDMGGNIQSMEMVYESENNKKVTTPDLTPRKIKIDVNYVNKLLGLSLKDEEVKKYLEQMGYGISGSDALIPAYRADILHPVDLVEDVGIAYGYENFNEELPSASTIGKEDELQIFRGKIATMLAGLGLTEVNTMHLINTETQTVKMESLDIKPVTLIDPVSKEYDSLRFWMLPSLLDILALNRHNEIPQNIFDTGVIFKKNPKMETNVEEAIRLGVLLCDAEVDYTKIKQVLDYIMRMIGVEYSVEATVHPSFIPGRVGRVIVGKEKVAYIGEISPQVLTNFELENPVAALELNLSDLFDIIKN